MRAIPHPTRPSVIAACHHALVHASRFPDVHVRPRAFVRDEGAGVETAARVLCVQASPHRPDLLLAGYEDGQLAYVAPPLPCGV